MQYEEAAPVNLRRNTNAKAQKMYRCNLMLDHLRRSTSNACDAF